MKAVISGAGVAGLTLAAQLGNGGWDVIVVERDPAPSRSNYLVDLEGQGLVAAGRLGLMTRLLELGERVSRVCWVNDKGGQIAELDLTENARAHHQGIKILRGDLERALLESLPQSVEVRFGFDVSQIRTPADGVDITLRPGGLLKADVLIGADGIHSHIRDLVFGDGGLWSRTLGYDTAAFAFENERLQSLLAGRLNVLCAPGRNIVLCPMRTGRIAVVFIHRSAGPVPPTNPAAYLGEIYGGLKWCVPTLLRAASIAEDLRYEPATQIKLPAWHRGRIGLLGDACHAYSLLPGQGASVAMAAAFWLGTEMLRAPSVDMALAWYQDRLSSDIAARRASARRAAHWLVPTTRRDLVMRNGLLRLASVPGVARLLRPVMSGIA